MNKLITVLTGCFLALLLIVGCASKRDAGALTGAAVGATIGSHVGKGSGRILAIFFGSIIGSEMGRTLGSHMDEHDRMRTAEVLEFNKSYQQSSWQNPDTGRYYKVIPKRTYTSDTGPCREFIVDANIGGKTQQLYGTACRQKDGSWKMLKY